MLKKLTFMFLIISALFTMLNAAEKYAVLITGEKAPHFNNPYAAFWNDTYLMWEMLYLKGFDPKNIYVLYSDGVDGGEDQPSYISPRYFPANAGFTTPGYQITDYPATVGSIEEVTSILQGKSTENDFLFVWTFGHGYKYDEVGGSHLNLYSGTINN